MTDNHKHLRHIAGVLRCTQAIALVVACVAGGALWSEASGFQDADRWVEHSHEVLEALNDTRVDILRAGVWVRSLSIQPSDHAREQVRRACDQAAAESVRLQELTLDNPAQQARAKAIVEEVGKTANWIRAAADTGEASGRKALTRLLQTYMESDSTRPLPAELDAMQAEEQRLLRERFDRQGRHLVELKRVAVLTALGLACFLAWSLTYSSRLTRRGHRQIARLAAVSSEDPLTGLLNRRALLLGVDSLREGMSYAVVAFDLDDFKPVNDEHGHGAGDEVLTAVAARLREQCRDQDLLARIGGDEFVAVLPGVCEQRLADIIVTRIRLALGEPIAIEGGEVRIGASLGVAIRGLDGMEFTELLKQADERSYIAKRRAKGLPEIERKHDDAASAGRAASKPRLTLVG